MSESVVKKYKAIFFDWDGTAVITREAPVDDILPRMIALLEKGFLLAVVSGTTYDKIAKGKLHESIPKPALKNLYFCLGRGAYNYGFNQEGELVVLHDEMPDSERLMKIHELSFKIHKYLLQSYNYNTDIVFARPNYCKIDLLVNLDRQGKLYFQEGELVMLNNNLELHGITGGVKGLIDYTVELGKEMGLQVEATTDAKFLEVGISTKGNNINYILENVVLNKGIAVEDCCFWGDEFTYLGPGVRGSDAFMITEKSSKGDFYDVCEQPFQLPTQVRGLGGSVKTFMKFLDSQML